MNRNSLLDIKRRLTALSLAAACTLVLAGCGGDTPNDSGNANSNNITTKSNDDYDTLIYFLEDRAVVIYARYYQVVDYGKIYHLYEDGKEPIDLSLPAENCFVVGPEASFTPEEFIAVTKDPDFPIYYLNDVNKDVTNISR